MLVLPFYNTYCLLFLDSFYNKKNYLKNILSLYKETSNIFHIIFEFIMLRFVELHIFYRSLFYVIKRTLYPILSTNCMVILRSGHLLVDLQNFFPLILNLLWEYLWIYSCIIAIISGQLLRAWLLLPCQVHSR